MCARVNSSLAMRGSNNQLYRHCNNDDSNYYQLTVFFVCNYNKEISGFIYIALAMYGLVRCYDVYHITHRHSLDCNSHYNPLGSGGVQQTLWWRCWGQWCWGQASPRDQPTQQVSTLLIHFYLYVYKHTCIYVTRFAKRGLIRAQFQDTLFIAIC